MFYYIKVLFRSYFRHKSSSIINLIGLTTGLACTLFIYLWVQDERSIDKFHEKDDRLYRVMEFQTYTDKIVATNSTPYILAENLKIDFPEVEHAATTTWVNPFLVTYGEESFRERGFNVGEDFFNIFSYPLLEGLPSEVLKTKTSICISRKLAGKFFRNIKEAIGKPLVVQGNKTFIVSGVFENVPDNSTYKFDFVLPYKEYQEKTPWANSWGSNGPSTFVTLKEGTNPDLFTEKISNYVKLKHSPDSKVELFLKKYSEQYLYGKYTNRILDGGRIEYVQLFSVIALFILLIACINFMNLSTARASKRAHEVGVRKALGANKDILIKQFLSESLILAFFSMLFAYITVQMLLPQFNEITDKSIVLNFSPQLIIVSLLAILVTGILAGSYPALYLSSFEPARVLKGEIKNSVGEIWARKGLVIFQFTITVILIISVTVIYRQIQFAYDKNLGYNHDNVISFLQEGNVRDKSESFFAELKKIPGVVNASGVSHGLVGKENSTDDLSWTGKNPIDRIPFEIFNVDHDFLNTMELELLTGRGFEKEFRADSSKIVINEAAAKAMGLESPVGENVKLWEELDMTVIGVLKDFHYQSIHRNVAPAIFMLGDGWNTFVRVEAGNELTTLDRIQELYESYNPAFYFEFEFLNKRYRRLYQSELKVSQLSSYFTGVAILISCLGLFGLVSFTAERRIKEIGIRKVLGATVTNIVMMLSKDFTQLVGISILLAVPVSWYLMDEWLSNFAYKIDLRVWVFPGASAVSLLIAWLTVASQAFRAANINPAKCLKDE